jgi:ribosome-binding protein aMBF1 (putative translation factor)
MAVPRLSRAATLLRKKLKRRGMQRALTLILECPEGMVSRWVSGERVPSLAYAASLERILEIRTQWWSEPASPPRAKAA